MVDVFPVSAVANNQWNLQTPCGAFISHLFVPNGTALITLNTTFFLSFPFLAVIRLIIVSSYRFSIHSFVIFNPSYKYFSRTAISIYVVVESLEYLVI